MTLWLAVDISGSMCETGRLFIVREILRVINQMVSFNKLPFSLKYLTVGETTNEINWSNPAEYPDQFLKVQKKFNAEQFISFMNNKTSLEDKLLLITDGSWSIKEDTVISALPQNILKNKLFFLKVDRLSSNNIDKYSAFSAEDLHQAFQAMLETREIVVNTTSETNNNSKAFLDEW